MSYVGNKMFLYAEKAATISASGVDVEMHPCRTDLPMIGNLVFGPSTTKWPPEVDH